MSDSDHRAANVLHHRNVGLSAGDPVTVPVTMSSVAHLPSAPQAPFIYGRFSNPTWEAVEAQLAIWEGAPVLTFPSGMATITAVFCALLKAGDRILIPSDGYYAARALSEMFMAKLGVVIETCPTADMGQADLTGIRLCIVETPSNPGLDVVDISAVAVRAKASNTCLVVDNTTATACLQRPLDLGADVVIAADTKAPAGHSDLLFGHVASNDPAIMSAVGEWRKFSGSIPGPMEAWLTHRGLETLELRLQRMCDSADVIATRLRAHPAVRAIRFPGLPDDRSHAVAAHQMQRFGHLISFTLENRDIAEQFIADCPYIVASTSFGGVHSSAECRVRWGDDVAEGFIRMSIGIEPTETLWSAMAQALPAA